MSNLISEYDAGLDLKFTLNFIEKWGRRFSTLFRCRYDNLIKKTELSNPTIIVFNHGNGLWGILDVILIGYFWYIILDKKNPLYGMSEQAVFNIPLLGNLARKLGLKVASMSCLEKCLEDGGTVCIPPGGTTDQLRSIWEVNNPIFSKLTYRKGTFKFKPQTWFIHVAIKKGIPIHTLSITGTHIVTPILHRSIFLYKYLGLAKTRGNEFWAGYPITLNHIINMCIFYMSPLGDNAIAWIIFLILNIYLDILYNYPILFPKVTMKLNYSQGIKKLTTKEIKQIDYKNFRIKILQELQQNIIIDLSRIDKERKSIII